MPRPLTAHTHRHLGTQVCSPPPNPFAILIAKPHMHINRYKTEATRSCDILPSSHHTPGLLSFVSSFVRSALVRLPELKSTNSPRRIALDNERASPVLRWRKQAHRSNNYSNITINHNNYSKILLRVSQRLSTMVHVRACGRPS